MAEQSGSPAFKPPVNAITTDSPQFVRVDLTKVDWGFRASQKPPQVQDMPLKHVPNGS